MAAIYINTFIQTPIFSSFSSHTTIITPLQKKAMPPIPYHFLTIFEFWAQVVAFYMGRAFSAIPRLLVASDDSASEGKVLPSSQELVQSLSTLNITTPLISLISLYIMNDSFGSLTTIVVQFSVIEIVF